MTGRSPGAPDVEAQVRPKSRWALGRTAPQQPFCRLCPHTLASGVGGSANPPPEGARRPRSGNRTLQLYLGQLGAPHPCPPTCLERVDRRKEQKASSQSLQALATGDSPRQSHSRDPLSVAHYPVCEHCEFLGCEHAPPRKPNTARIVLSRLPYQHAVHCVLCMRVKALCVRPSGWYPDLPGGGGGVGQFGASGVDGHLSA